MKFTYYGTAAAEGVPALFCDCDTCNCARDRRGRNIRTRSQAMVDDKILIDFPPDTYLHVLNYNMPLKDVSSCLLTHNHSDHLCAGEIEFRHIGFSHLKNDVPFKIFGTSETLSKIYDMGDDIIHDMTDKSELVLNEIKPFESFIAEGYKITPLKADHCAEGTVFYLIQKENKSILYAHDTGVFPKEVLEWFKENPVKIDLLSLDCTNVLLNLGERNHMGLSENVKMKEILTEMGSVDENTKCIINHFSHNGLAGYDELVEIADRYGFEVSYDNMKIEF